MILTNSTLSKNRHSSNKSKNKRRLELNKKNFYKVRSPNLKRFRMRLLRNRLNRDITLRFVSRSNNLFIHLFKGILKKNKASRLKRSFFYTSTGSFGFRNASKSSTTTIDKVLDRFIPLVVSSHFSGVRALSRSAHGSNFRLANIYLDPRKRMRSLFWLLATRFRKANVQVKSWFIYDRTPFGGTRLRKVRRK